MHILNGCSERDCAIRRTGDHLQEMKKLTKFHRQDWRWKPIGQQHNLIFMPCFALTIYGWKWACGGHLERFQGDWFTKGTLHTGVREHGFINQNFLWRTTFPAFGRTYTFSINPTHCFINETPGQLIPIATNWLGQTLQDNVLSSFFQKYLNIFFYLTHWVTCWYLAVEGIVVGLLCCWVHCFFFIPPNHWWVRVSSVVNILSVLLIWWFDHPTTMIYTYYIILYIHSAVPKFINIQGFTIKKTKIIVMSCMQLMNTFS